MAEEPQPSNIQEGASTSTAPAPSGDAAKEAAALSALDARGEDEDAKPSNKLAIDQEALGKAISRLEVSAGEGAAGKVKDLGGQFSEKRKAEEEKKKAEEERKRKIKVDQADVTLLVSLNPVSTWVRRIANS